VVLVRTDVSVERIAFIIMVATIHQLVTANVLTSSPILVTLLMVVIRSYETSVLIRATWRHTPEDGILPHEYVQHQGETF
jgi:hypothetical protein